MPPVYFHGHHAQGLFDELDPRMTAVVDDVLAGFEELESELPCMNCRTFSSGLGSGASHQRFTQMALAYRRKRMAGLLGAMLRGGRLLRLALMRGLVEHGALV